MKKSKIIFTAIMAISLLVFSGCERIRETYGRQLNITESGPAPVTVFAVNTKMAGRFRITLPYPGIFWRRLRLILFQMSPAGFRGFS
jgi:hypothetical protein